uniref:Retrovirus-related Pol polyprotein from transposon TNT 1-94 n=1 Tax=Tanacetum cinerariifolium TaxID=118510 RepID=A0A6L2MI05_TANCI|nr:retrovirus-related Pol polyprotein from transposon TNT 1-94 [Tanacetum cinerariifolium]
MAEDGKLKIDNMMVMISISRTNTGAEGTTEGRKQNRNKSKSWKIGEIKYMQNITCWNCNQKGHFQNQCSKLVASTGKEVNMETGDFDGALFCCVENTVEDRIGDVVLKTSFGTSWTLKDVRYIPGLKRRLISVGQLDEEGYHVGFRDQQWNVTKDSLVVARGNKRGSLYMVELPKAMFQMYGRGWSQFIQKAMVLHLLHQHEDPTTMILLSKTATGVAEEWRGNDTSLAHLKVFGCDSIVRVKDVCEEAMKCTFIGSGSDEIRYSFRDTRSHQVIRSRDITFMDLIYGARSATDSSSLTKLIQESQVVLVDIPENLAENDTIVEEHGGRSDEEYSEDGASSNEGGFEILQVRRSTRESKAPKKAINEEMFSFEKNQTCSLVRISAGKKASQILWMFMVKEEQNISKRYKVRLVVKGFQQKRGDVHQVSDEIEVEVLHSFNWLQSELIMEEGFLPERVQRVPYVRRHRKVRAVALLKRKWFEVYRDYLRRRAVK